LTSAFILVDIKAGLRSNSELLEVNPTQRTAKIGVLDGSAYPEFRLTYIGIGINTIEAAFTMVFFINLPVLCEMTSARLSWVDII